MNEGLKRRCCFAGHSVIEDYNIREMIKRKSIEVIEKYGVNEFWVGNYGAFDSCAMSVINELKNLYDIKLNLVIPYLTKEINENREWYYKNYDNILIADIVEGIPGKYKILECNQYMIDQCVYLICYVKYSWGGAAKTIEYARRKKHIEICNLADM